MSVSFQVVLRKGGRLFAAPRREPEAAEAIRALLVPRAMPVTGTAVILVRPQVPAYTAAALVIGGTGIAASAAIVFIPT